MEYFDKSVYSDIAKGFISESLGWQETEISGKELKELTATKATRLEVKMARLEAVMGEILKDCRVEPNKPMSDWELEGAFLPEGYEPKVYSYELCNYAQEIGYDMPNEATVVSYSKGKDFDVNIDDFPVSDGEKEERMRYNETMREWVNTRKDWVMLKAYADHHDEKQKVKIPYRLLVALKN